MTTNLVRLSFGKVSPTVPLNTMNTTGVVDVCVAGHRVLLNAAESSARSKSSRKSGSSNRAAHVSSIQTPSGIRKKVVQYNARGLRDELDDGLAQARQRRADEFLERDKAKFRRLDDFDASDDFPDENDSPDHPLPLEPEDILGGGVPLDISHAGGELLEILLEENNQRNPQKYVDWRTRRDHVEIRNEGFRRQLPSIVNAYLEWDKQQGDHSLENACPTPAKDTDKRSAVRLQVMDVFWTRVIQTDVVDGPEGIPAALTRRGMIPCAPLRPSLAVTIRLLEFYRNIHLSCPHVSTQSFVRGLCNFHGLHFRPYFSVQFSICYDLYLEIQANVANSVNVCLGRDASNWRLKNACPACTYRLDGEDALTYNMLVTMDGNDSLKRVIRKDVYVDPADENGRATTVGKEALDTRKVTGDYYLTREMVDRWAKDRVMEAIRQGSVDAENPCAGRWTNMANEITARMWGVFDETGIFLALCRHGFVLLVADMVQSGELAKYPLAVVEALLTAFGSGIGVGYDIGCRFGTTLAHSELGDQVRDQRLKTLVGAFHGHAHNRLCQLTNLTTYVEGIGLEDLEGCERFFSKSNALAASVRYSSSFHRRQRIAEYMRYMDVMETSESLSEFLVNNYKQALQIINGEKDLYEAMRSAGVGPDDFQRWLREEKDYLTSLSKEPEVETLHISYYQALVKLKIHEDQISQQQLDFVAYQPTDGDVTARGKRPRQGPNRGLRLMHAREQHSATLGKVHDLERSLEVEKRWMPGSAEWEKAAMLFNHRHYQQCLDELESLVVSRLFELGKMNMAQTGYKLRKHIGNALRQRSQAIRNALDRYNAAAEEMKPPRAKLTWERVVSYDFLADFILLRDCREDITKRSWAQPHNRSLMDRYFKTLRAHEEIRRLNIEIQRVITYLQDEEQFLHAREKEISGSDAFIAHQIRRLRIKSMLFKDVHLRRFHKLALVPGFSGTIDPGTSINRSRHLSSGDDRASHTPSNGEGEELVDEQAVLEEQEEIRLQEMDKRLQVLSSLMLYEGSALST